MIHRTIYMYWLSGFIGVHDFEHVNRFQNPIPFPPSVCLILCCVMCKVNCFTKSSWPLSLCFMVNFKWCDLIFWIANIQDNCIQSFASHSQQNQCILVLSCCYMYALCQIFTKWCMHSRCVLEKICYARQLYTSIMYACFLNFASDLNHVMTYIHGQWIFSSPGQIWRIKLTIIHYYSQHFS